MVKSISKYVTTYSRANTYDDTILENKRKLSYFEYDENGNICRDEMYNELEECENLIKRRYENGLLVEEMFFDGEEDALYEHRTYFYDGNKPVECKIDYGEDANFEKYIHDEDGRLLKKEIFFSDGDSFVENEYTWEDGLLIKSVEYLDKGVINTVRTFYYDQEKRPIKIELHEFEQNNKTSESYQYDERGNMIQQNEYNYKGDLITKREKSYNEENLLISHSIETATQYFKYTYEYNENKQNIRESIFNQEDILLTDKQISYDDSGNEKYVEIYSKNIVESDKDEMILIELYENEYVNF